jgi:hypothetical protein
MSHCHIPYYYRLSTHCGDSLYTTVGHSHAAICLFYQSQRYVCIIKTSYFIPDWIDLHQASTPVLHFHYYRYTGQREIDTRLKLLVFIFCSMDWSPINCRRHFIYHIISLQGQTDFRESVQLSIEYSTLCLFCLHTLFNFSLMSHVLHTHTTWLMTSYNYIEQL